MNKFTKISICLFSGIILISSICVARTGTVNAPSGLVLRETASKSAKPLTTIDDNTKVEIIEESGEWYKVKYGIYEGYMFAEYVEAEKIEEQKVEEKMPETEKPAEEQNQENTKPVEQAEENTEKVYPQNIATNSNIAMHSIPSISSKVILNIEQSKTITVNYELNDWLNITYEGKQGWIRKYNVNMNENTEANKPAEESTQPEEQNNSSTEQSNTKIVENGKGYIDVTNSANVRESASTSASVITTLLRNTQITILGEEGDFYKIQYQDMTGYIAKSLISDTAV